MCQLIYYSDTFNKYVNFFNLKTCEFTNLILDIFNKIISNCKNTYTV